MKILLGCAAAFGVASLMMMSDNEINMPDGRCEQINNDNVFSAFNNNGDVVPKYTSKELLHIPEGDISFTSSKVFSGETTDSMSHFKVITDGSGGGECRVRASGDLFAPTKVYALSKSS